MGLTCYLISKSADHDFDSPLDLEETGGAKLTAIGPTQFADFEARLIVARTPPREPDWAGFIRSGFSSAPPLNQPSTGAVLLVKVTHGGGTRMMAFTFGTGRFLLRSDSWERSFGMRTSLNVIFEGDDGSLDASRLRVLDAKRVEFTTLRTRQQANKQSTLEEFEFDLRRDLLRAVEGKPVDSGTWGERVGGSDALHLGLDPNFGELGKLSRRVVRASQGKDYKTRFAWIDNLRVVSDEEEVSALQETLLADLRNRNIENLDMAPPEILDWSQVSRFRFDFDKRAEVKRPEPRLSEYLTGLSARGKLDDLDVAKLKRDHLWALDAGGQPRYKWTIWRSLSGSFDLDKKSYVFDEGVFYQVAKNYQEQLDDYIEGLIEWSGSLPTATVGLHEEDYNHLAATSSPDYLLLDQKFVRAPERTSPIEVCDVLTSDGELVHIKKSWGASLLSHLFSQGAVSAELLAALPAFREEALKVIETAEESRIKEASDTSFRGRFQSFKPDALVPKEHPVVFGVIAEWKGSGLERIPFFSKVNLRRSVERLHELGFDSFYKRIELVT